MRSNKARLKQMAGDDLLRKGVTFRTIHDADGEASIALIFFVPDPGRTASVVAALADENIPATRLYQNLKYLPHDHIDLHVYTSWAPILRQRAWSARGGPWRQHPRKIEYSQGMCPRTIDLLERAVHIDISPELTPTQVEQFAEGIRKVIGAEL
jgi:dTDP-4-amino-4,6-dideoxygalactose transaminase